MLRGGAGGCRYRLQPEVVILEPVLGDKADALAAACPGLFGVEDRGAARRAVAGDARQHEKQLEKVRQRLLPPWHSLSGHATCCPANKLLDPLPSTT